MKHQEPKRTGDAARRDEGARRPSRSAGPKAALRRGAPDPGRMGPGRGDRPQAPDAARRGEAHGPPPPDHGDAVQRDRDDVKPDERQHGTGRPGAL